jgi:hypothetical protein
MAIEEPRMVSNERRFTAVGDDITVLHDVVTCSGNHAHSTTA